MKKSGNPKRINKVRLFAGWGLIVLGMFSFTGAIQISNELAKLGSIVPLVCFVAGILAFVIGAITLGRKEWIKDLFRELPF